MRPGTLVILRARPWKWASVGVICLVFAILGSWMPQPNRWIGRVGQVFFGFGVLISVISLMPAASYLKLDADGFTVSSMYRAQTIRWADVTGFGVGRIFLNKMVMFNFEPSYTRTPGFRSFNAAVVGYEAALPDNYGLKHEELVDLLNRYRESSLAG